MKGSDLVFLEERDAQLLAVAWTHLDEPRTEERWLRLAGADRPDLARVLSVSGICLKDGTTDSLALQFIAKRLLHSAGIKVPREQPSRP